MDMTPFTTLVTEITTNVGVAGAATVAIFSAALGFPFVMRWGKKALNAGTGRAG